MLIATALLLSALAADPISLPKLDLPKDAPRIVDDRLKLELIAEAPNLVTPTGLTINRLGHVLVVECHTHFRPPNYQGPPADRILAFVDTNKDGIPDKRYVFFEGTIATMNVACHPNGWIYVATRNEVFRIRDTDADNVSDKRESLVKLETPGFYPHNGLSGFAFDSSGNVVFGMGENLGADYRLIANDKSEFKGGGEGGNIFRCSEDGKKLVRIATGFWNPFHLCFDVFGQLFAVDNDPDSRPPCRLLHIVEGGDYGYRFRNGRRGVHPFTAWNGELPGTLPMVAGTGEAPSGMLAYESDNLPEDYLGDLLVTSWGDHRIERYPLKLRGASYTSTMKPVLIGGDNFRPVGIATAHDGSLFFSDWVDKSYQLHGKGRLWRLSNKTVVEPKRPTDAKEALKSLDRRTREEAADDLAKDPNEAIVLQQLREADSPLRIRAAAIASLADRPLTNRFGFNFLPGIKDPALQCLATSHFPLVSGSNVRYERYPLTDLKLLSPLALATAMRSPKFRVLIEGKRNVMTSADPFIRQAVRQAYANDLSEMPASTADDIRKGLQADDPGQRVEFALIARQIMKDDRVDIVRKLLTDSDPTVRFVAIQWGAEEGLVKQVQAELDAAVKRDDTTRELLEAYLVAIAPRGSGPVDPKQEAKGEDFIAKLLLAPDTNVALRRFALRSLRPDHPALTFAVLDRFLKDDDAAIRLEAVRSLREKTGVDRDQRLRTIALDPKASDIVRAEAVMGIAPESDDNQAALGDLADEGSLVVAAEALRSLRRHLKPVDYQVLSKRIEGRTAASPTLASLLEAGRAEATNGSLPAPNQTAEWLKRIEGIGDPDMGERVFFHLKAGSCSRCHAMNGRGGGLGPDLTQTASRLTKERLLKSILEPSQEIAPQFVPWQITTTDGRNFTALLTGEEVDGTQIYRDQSGKIYRLKPLEIEERRPSEKSLMPEGLEKQMTREELRDLLAFLGKSK